MLKKVLVAAGVVAGVLVIGCICAAWWAYLLFTGPMYEPGRLAALPSLAPPAQTGEPETWLVERDVRLHYFRRGTGRPVVFVHGGPGFPTRAPMPWLEALYESFEIYFYDQRGCGLSTRPFDRFDDPNTWANIQRLEAKLGMGAQLADIERIRRILRQERLVLIGHSFGGFIATLYAAEFPERVERLVLLAPADMLAMSGAGEDLLERVRDRLPQEQRAGYDALLDEYLDFGSLFDHDEESLARLNLRLGSYMLEAMGIAPDAIPAVPGLSETGGWVAHAIYLSLGRHHDYRDALSTIAADTLVVHGDRDLAPASVGAQYVRLIANAELLRVPDADHFFWGDHEGLRQRVAAFLRRP